MKTVTALATIFTLSGCVSAHPAWTGPTPLAEGAQAGMWSSKEPGVVGACLAQVQKAAIAPERGDPLRFQVDPGDAKLTRYSTRVSVFGDVASNKLEAEAAASCL